MNNMKTFVINELGSEHDLSILPFINPLEIQPIAANIYKNVFKRIFFDSQKDF